MQIAEILASYPDESEDEGSDSVSVYDNKKITICGVISRTTVKNTKKGDDMAFVEVEDRYADIEVIVFPNVYRTCSGYLTYDTPVFVVGTVTKRDEEKPKILCDGIYPLTPDEEYKQTSEPVEKKKPDHKKLYVRVPSAEPEKYPEIERIKAVISIYEDDFVFDRAIIYSTDNNRKYVWPNGVNITDGMIRALVGICGEENVRLIC